MTWSGQRKTYIIIGLVVLALIPLFTWLFLLVYQAPSCSDNLQNGAESGVDCGGSCQQVCVQDVYPLEVVWQRTFSDGDGSLAGIALIENRNTLADAQGVEYTFTLFSEGVELDSKTQTTLFPAGKRTPVIIKGLTYGSRIIDHTSFAVNDVSRWFKTSNEERLLKISNERVDNDGGAIKIFAQVTNDSFQDVYREIDFVVIAYNQQGSVLGYSTTYLEAIEPQEEVEIFLSWKQESSDAIARIEIIPLKSGHGF
jgi:hypothetical protein